MEAEKQIAAAFNPRSFEDFALAEANKVFESELERRKSSDQKATTYLAVVAALIPIVLTLASAVWDKKAGEAPAWINMLLLAISVGYVATAGVWSFECVKFRRLRRQELATSTKPGEGQIHYGNLPETSYSA